MKPYLITHYFTDELLTSITFHYSNNIDEGAAYLQIEIKFDG